MPETDQVLVGGGLVAGERGDTERYKPLQGSAHPLAGCFTGTMQDWKLFSSNWNRIKEKPATGNTLGFF